MKAIDITGQKFGRLTVVEKVGSKKGEGVLWRCKCDCGGEVEVTGKKLRNGNTKSCGCIAKELLVARNKASGTHGMTATPTWISWDSMKQRCLNVKHKSYAIYGGRGIKICDRWLESFEDFLADMGERPEGMTLDRIDVDGDYTPGNCRWATSETQSNNRTNNRLVEYRGVTQTLAKWARELGISRQALRYRLDHGWSIREAFEMKLNHGNGWKREVAE